MTYVAVILCALAATAHCYWGPNNRAAAAGVASQGYDQGYDVAGGLQHAAGVYDGGEQGMQAGQGRYEFGLAQEGADAHRSAGRYDHEAQFVSAMEKTSAAAESAGGEYSSGAAYGYGEDAYGAQGAGHEYGAFQGLENGGYETSGQRGGHYAQGQGQVEPIALRQATPVLVQPAAYYQYPVVADAGYAVGGRRGFAGPRVGAAGAYRQRVAPNYRRGYRVVDGRQAAPRLVPRGQYTNYPGVQPINQRRPVGAGTAYFL